MTTTQSGQDTGSVTTRIVDYYDGRKRAWVKEAIRLLHADATRSADTHVFRFPLPPQWGIDLYVKDESVHPSGSLKHRMARALYLHALCSGWIGPDTHVIEASSGSTAVSEAYFAQLLDLRFTAVVPKSTSEEKVALIKAYGGAVQNPGDDGDIEKAAAHLAEGDDKGHFMDQFTYAERAYDYRDDHNVAATVFQQIAEERHPEPSWVVVGAGTGGTSATIGRHIRFSRRDTRVCVVDPQNSAFFPNWKTHRGQPKSRWPRDPSTWEKGSPSHIEGIGRPRVEPSFLPAVVDRMISVPDAASIAAMRLLLSRLRHRAGPSTGTNLWGALRIVAEMLSNGQKGSVVMLMCDQGERYMHSYYDDKWVEQTLRLNLEPYTKALEDFLSTGNWEEPVAATVPEARKA
ncbi:MAG TPA: PLP-dependent cysteine synthase family protein [Nocardiopsis listeri]|uniref:PLP-dependent cysteine synthase family protein n=1 Tax=Nocardiopsis listeri TaxID=53440 RepID=UPI001DF84B62|nr:PLP-dependent cysteine synthase family protein [Nocardiopsis listeri]HJE60707.1 PLP-dependent cysteine synthase family protein [Nocardiopsis listeri]